MTMLALQICSSFFALLGTWLLRKPGPANRWGFVCWTISNPCVMAFLAMNGHWVLVAQHAVFWVLAVQGVCNWWGRR